MATFEEQYRKYSTSGQGQAINDLYDAKKQSQLTQLESAYQASKSEAEAARDKLPGQYQQQANDLAAQYERNRRNFNIQAAGVYYSTGYKAQRGGRLWRCVQAHTSQTGWEPENAPSLWAKVLIPDETVIPEWEQPDSTNAYAKGDKVTHNGKMWVSDVDGNVWEPGVYGWTEQSE